MSLLVGPLLVAGVAAGCLSNPGIPAGSSRHVITVSNSAAWPAVLEVGRGGLGGQAHPVGQANWVGVAQPATVPSGATQPVTFFVPPSGDWSIYANGGELMGSRDVNGRGRLDLGIQVDANGEPSWSCSPAPGAACP
ncbi:MAG TPA: hypothetical protein VIF84_08730 [Candidatus Limnocylindrales bacterium]|jgi:hypothetical protein